MTTDEVACSRVLTVLAVATWSISAIGCGSAPDPVEWPDAKLATERPVADVDVEPTLMRGDDGLLYAVGDFEEPPRRGQLVFGIHDGQWPVEDAPRPALFAGEVVDYPSDGVAQVHGLYEFPDLETDGLGVEIVDDRGGESMGKGLEIVDSIDTDDESQVVTIELGAAEGVQKGDIYGLIRRHKSKAEPQDGQLTRRLSNICRIVEVDSGTSRCQLRRGHPKLIEDTAVRQGDFAVFLEPTVDQKRRPARVLVSQVDDPDINQEIRQHLEEYFSEYPHGDISVEFFDQQGDGPPIEDWQGRGGEGGQRWADEEIDARDTEFHRWRRRLETDEPALLVGVNLEGDNIVVNYSGLGTAVGPGLVAAPPEGGVDMGEALRLGDERWDGFASMLKGTMLVYRGETAEALAHLRQALRTPGLEGPWRWHARDQLAMRWAALDRFEEALWLVHEDEALGRSEGDDRARYNALGTRVRLHDFVDQHHVAYQAAGEYLQARSRDDQTGRYLSAVAMNAEMAAAADKLDEARAHIDELYERCPDGCQGDLIALLAGIYWAAMDDGPDLQDEIVELMLQVGQRDVANTLATARMFQGWNHMRDDDMDWSMVAFREARRRFQEQGSAYGEARAKFYLALALAGRDEGQEAFEYAVQSLEYMTKIGDYTSMVRIYERIAQIFVPVDPEQPRQRYMAEAPRFLQTGLQAQLATGDYGRASEAGFGYGHYLLMEGHPDEARQQFRRSARLALRTVRFDMVALSYLFLGMMAQMEGDTKLYDDKIERAKNMADAADDPFVDEMIDEILPSDEPREEQQDPTQLL